MTQKPSWALNSMTAVLLMAIIVSGCAPTSNNSVSSSSQNSVQAAQAVPTQATLAQTLPSTPCDTAEFVADVTIPVGTVLPPETKFTKTWRFRNVGSCTWTTAYQVVFVNGDLMSAPEAISLPQDVAAGQTVDISIEMVAPLTDGLYRGYWIFKNPNGIPFGVGTTTGTEPWLVEINVLANTLTPSFTPTITDTPTPSPTATATPNPIDELAVRLAKELFPQFSELFGIEIDPSLAKGLDAIRIGGDSGQLAGMVAPVIDENQKYSDNRNKVREVEGIFSINDSRLTLESMNIINKATIQYPLLPLGAYMLACDLARPNDCIAVSLDGKEYQIKPDSVFLTVTDAVPFPVASYEEGSIYKCFRVLRRKICIRVF